MFKFPFYRPGRKAKDIKSPLLITVCEQDAITPAAPAVKSAQQAPRAELLRYPYRHFQIYLDPRTKADQVAFLQWTVQCPPGSPRKCPAPAVVRAPRRSCRE